MGEGWGSQWAWLLTRHLKDLLYWTTDKVGLEQKQKRQRELSVGRAGTSGPHEASISGAVSGTSETALHTHCPGDTQVAAMQPVRPRARASRAAAAAAHTPQAKLKTRSETPSAYEGHESSHGLQGGVVEDQSSRYHGHYGCKDPARKSTDRQTDSDEEQEARKEARPAHREGGPACVTAELCPL